MVQTQPWRIVARVPNNCVLKIEKGHRSDPLRCPFEEERLSNETRDCLRQIIRYKSRNGEAGGDILKNLPTPEARRALAREIHDERSWDRAFREFWGSET